MQQINIVKAGIPEPKKDVPILSKTMSVRTASLLGSKTTKEFYFKNGLVNASSLLNWRSWLNNCEQINKHENKKGGVTFRISGDVVIFKHIKEEYTLKFVYGAQNFYDQFEWHFFPPELKQTKPIEAVVKIEKIERSESKDIEVLMNDKKILENHIKMLKDINPKSEENRLMIEKSIEASTNGILRIDSVIAEKLAEHEKKQQDLLKKKELEEIEEEREKLELIGRQIAEVNQRVDSHKTTSYATKAALPAVPVVPVSSIGATSSWCDQTEEEEAAEKAVLELAMEKSLVDQ